MELLADRFLRVENRLTIDLATNEEVWWRPMSVGRLPEQIAWETRCAALFRLRHPQLLTLIDYGLLGRAGRFEAFSPTASHRLWRRRDRETARALSAVVNFLHANRLSAGCLSWDRVLEVADRPVLVPDDLTGMARSNEEGRDAIENPRPDLAEFLGDMQVEYSKRLMAGIALQPQAAIRQLAELFDATAAAGPRWVHLLGVSGSGTTTTLMLTAREARVRGFVPLCLKAAARPGVIELLTRCHILLMCELASNVSDRHARAALGFARRPDRRRVRHSADSAPMAGERQAASESGLFEGAGRLPHVVLRLGVESPRPHIILTAGDELPQGASCLKLMPLPPAALIDMISIDHNKGAAALITSAARRAQGRPGVFLRILDGKPAFRREENSHEATSTHQARRVAEASGVYVTPAPVFEHPRSSPRLSAAISSASADVTDLPLRRTRLGADKGLALADRGLHALAERTLREAVGALARRRDYRGAGRTALALGRLLLERGRVSKAVRVFEQARTLFELAEEISGGLEATAHLGLAWTDAGRLLDAEAALRATHIAAQQVPDVSMTTLAAVGLARNLFWQGRQCEARALVQEGCDVATRHCPAMWRLRSRLAVARRDLPAAGAHAAAALHDAMTSGDLRELASAHATVAHVQAAIGELDTFRSHIIQGLSAARRAHSPLRALRLRLSLLEGLGAMGRRREARAIGHRLARRRSASLPPLLRARLHVALFRVGAGSDQDMKAVRAFIRLSGAKALEASTQEAPDMEMLQAVSDILQLCHEIEDERTALGRVCALVRDRLGAAAVVLYQQNPIHQILASAGACTSVPPGAAARALETGLSIPPAPGLGGLEAAAPVRYAGANIAALTSRWLVDAKVDLPRAEAILSAAAAACAAMVRAALDRSAVAVPTAPADLELLGHSQAIDDVRRAVSRAANAPFAVLIVGESGSGKELVARAVHRLGARRGRKFCALNCAALTDELLEAELFGHTRGAFTGALTERVGLFEEADGGTLFLDEVGELSARAQAKLLRVIQEGEVRRVGENFARRIDVRIIGATNRCLHTAVETGRFRQDLLYRLDVIRITVPPLRERVEDIAVLVAYFWDQAAARTGSRATLDPATIAALARYDWPGNVRELQNVMATLAVHAPRRGRVASALLPQSVAAAVRVSGCATLEEARRTFEQRFVHAALARAGGHRGRTAAELGLSRQGLTKLLARLDIETG